MTFSGGDRVEIGAASRSSVYYDDAVCHTHIPISSPLNLTWGNSSAISTTLRRWHLRLSHRIEDIESHVPLARSGAQIKNLDLALQRTPTQMVPNGTNVVAVQKSFKQFVLDIHSLYTSHSKDGDVTRKDWVSMWNKEECWSECGNGGMGLNRGKRTFCSCPSTGNGYDGPP